MLPKSGPSVKMRFGFRWFWWYFRVIWRRKVIATSLSVERNICSGSSDDLCHRIQYPERRFSLAKHFSDHIIFLEFSAKNGHQPIQTPETWDPHVTLFQKWPYPLVPNYLAIHQLFNLKTIRVSSNIIPHACPIPLRSVQTCARMFDGIALCLMTPTIPLTSLY